MLPNLTFIQTPATLVPRLFLVVLAIGLVASPGVTSESDELPGVTAENPMDILRSEVAAGESKQAIPQLKDMIADIESKRDVYSRELVEPLTLLGDAYLNTNQYGDALNSFQRASEVCRIADGTYSPTLLQITYRQALVFARVGAWQEATASHEYAYQLIIDEFEDFEHPNRMQGLLHLLDWYESTRNFSGALILLRQLKDHLVKKFPAAHPLLMDVRRNFVIALREVAYPTPSSRFAPRYRARVPGWNPDNVRRRSSSYDLGLKELKLLSEIVTDNPDSTSADKANSFLELADWHVLFSRPHKAIGLYRRAWDLLESEPELLKQEFEAPKIIHMGVNSNWISAQQATATQDGIGIGFVQLSLTINNRGKVVGRKTVSTHPNDLMEYRVRVIAERAKYRPAFKDRQPIQTSDVPFVYNYVLLDGSTISDDSQEPSSNPVQKR